MHTQQAWEALTQTLSFSTAARALLKNTVFENSDQDSLTLSLSERFSNLLTDSIKHSIQTTLQEHFGSITLNINLNNLKTQEPTAKKIQSNNAKMTLSQQNFLADEGVQKLQQVFNTKINSNSIRKVVKTSTNKE